MRDETPMIHVLGNATVDLTLNLSTLPLAGETVLARTLARGPGGKGLNQAVAAARAGAQVRLIAPVGTDAEARILTLALKAEPGLETRWRRADHPTDLSCIWVAEDGENMIASTAHCARAIGPDEVPELLGDLLPDDILVVQGNLGEETTRAACIYARAAGTLVLFNTAPIDWPAERTAALADIVVSNLPEAEAITGRGGLPAARALAAIARRAAIVTLGAEGAILADARGETRLPAPRVTARDTSGAGDTAVGYLAAALARGEELIPAVRLALAAASLSVTRDGIFGAIPRREELG
ncbi:PfkB family carbohydrate kinase [Acidimangrovimonas sediminis]|uniref:PfkB family carbohydrate kinase n=1 Tax=Acidimangrovimonas sediminis TaxID=2056283 RepID=UPI000C7FA68A|nr:PfkB family carbohydrate kinase [Acidimangrovimonas sediminis]